MFFETKLSSKVEPIQNKYTVTFTIGNLQPVVAERYSKESATVLFFSWCKRLTNEAMEYETHGIVLLSNNGVTIRKFEANSVNS